jgi:hypothetical protein
VLPFRETEKGALHRLALIAQRNVADQGGEKIVLPCPCPAVLFH